MALRGVGGGELGSLGLAYGLLECSMALGSRVRDASDLGSGLRELVREADLGHLELLDQLSVSVLHLVERQLQLSGTLSFGITLSLEDAEGLDEACRIAGCRRCG